MAGGKVYWDSFGSFPLESGIGSYSRQLHLSLQQIGLQAFCLLAQGESGAGLDPVVHLKANLGCLLNRIKLYWPHICFRDLEDFIRTNEDLGSVNIFHALSNLNLPIFSKKRTGFRYVVTVHDLIPLLPGAGVSKAYKAQFMFMLPKVITYADRILCVSNWTRDLLCERYPEAEMKSLTIENGVDHLSLDGQDCKRGQINGEKRNFLYVSRWEEYKGFEILAAVAERIPKNCLLTVVTDRIGFEKLAKLAVRALVRGTLRLESSLSVEDLRTRFVESDLYLHFSRYEGFGLPVWEALACRTPVLFKEGSAVDVIQNQGVAWSVDRSGSPQDWLDLINEKKDCKLSNVFQDNVTRFLVKSPRWSQAASQVKEVYNQLR